MRRRALLGLGLAVLAGEAAAQEAPPVPAAGPARGPSPARPRPRRPRRVAKPEPTPQQAESPPPRPQGPVFEAAPVPNRDLEAPRVVEKDVPRLSPSVIQRSLPSRGQAAEGNVNLGEERLFNPAPGARLNLPFKY